jgi:hypothetical protein
MAGCACNGSMLCLARTQEVKGVLMACAAAYRRGIGGIGHHLGLVRPVAVPAVGGGHLCRVRLVALGALGELAVDTVTGRTADGAVLALVVLQLFGLRRVAGDTDTLYVGEGNG